MVLKEILKPINVSADQLAFDAYLIGLPDQSTASFIHITLKALSGRSIEIRRNLSQRILEFTHKFFLNLKLPTRRCEITVDIVEMERETYTKILIKN